MAGLGNQSEGPITGINVTPLVDVVLVLLIIFIVTAKMVVTPALPVDLPRAAHTEEVQVILSVVVPARGATRIDDAQVADDRVFVARATDAATRTPDLRAVIAADGSVTHERVLHVLDLLRQAGVTRVAFGARATASESR